MSMMLSAPCGPGLPSSRRYRSLIARPVLRCRCGSGSRLGLWSSATSSGTVRPRSTMRSSATRRTLRRACRRWPSPTPSSSPTAPENFSPICSISKISGLFAESGANREQLCRILYWTGRMHFVLGNFDRGVEHAQQALRLAEEVGGGDDLTAEPINLLARIHCLRGEPAPAAQYAARNVGQMHRLGNRVEEAAVSGVLAFACGMSGRYRDAVNAAERGVVLARG